jgi:hypothetical protein
MRAQTRASLRTRTSMSGQTHHDRVGLNEEDGQEEVLRRRRGRNGHRTAPSVAQHESGDRFGYDDSTAENGAGDRGHEREVRLIGAFALRLGAAVVRLRLGDLVRATVFRAPCMQRAGTALGAARHSRFWARHPSSADGGIPGRQRESERESRSAIRNHHHASRMLDRTSRCQWNGPTLSQQHGLTLENSPRKSCASR